MPLKEVWLPIDSAPGYEVSSEGRVRHGERLLTTFAFRNRGGTYLMVGIRGARYVARLVAFAFLEPSPLPKARVKYLNGNSLDCRAVNLRWETEEDRRETSAMLTAASKAHIAEHGPMRKRLCGPDATAQILADAHELLQSKTAELTIRTLCERYAEALAGVKNKQAVVADILSKAGFEVPKQKIKLTSEDVDDIREEWARGGLRMIDLAVWKNVDASMISRIVNNTRR